MNFRRLFATAVAALSALPIAIAQAQGFPNKPIRIVVPFSPAAPGTC